MGLEEVDVSIVGAGPSGLIAAREAARLGLSVIVLEEDTVVGRPERCAGLYSLRGLRKIGADVSGRHVVNTIYGAEIRSPSNRCAVIRSREPVAVVAIREELDRMFAEQAIRAGATLKLGKRVTSVKKGNTIELRTNDGEVIRSKVLIDAEGHTGSIARRLFDDYKLDGWIPIVQFLVSGHEYAVDRVYVWLRPYLKEFFGYLIPVHDDVARVGVASKRDTMSKALKFLREVAPKSRIIGYVSSCIYVGPPGYVGLRGNAVLVGDVAGQVKPTTGGGVIIGGICARYAAMHAYALIQGISRGLYERKVRGINEELRRMYVVASLLRGLSDSQLDALIGAAQDSGITDVLSSRGDMDFQVTGLVKALLSPSAAKFAYLLAKALL